VILIARPPILFGHHDSGEADLPAEAGDPVEKGTPTERMIAVGCVKQFLATCSLFSLILQGVDAGGSRIRCCL
jgi:hypothetical protein